MVLIILRVYFRRVQSPFRWRARQEAPLCTSHLRRFLSIAANTNISVAVLFSLRRQDTSQDMCSRLPIIGSGSKQARVRPGREPGSKTCSRPQFFQPRSSSRCTTRTHAPHAQTPQPVSSLCSLFTFTFTLNSIHFFLQRHRVGFPTLHLLAADLVDRTLYILHFLLSAARKSKLTHPYDSVQHVRVHYYF